MSTKCFARSQLKICTSWYAPMLCLMSMSYNSWKFPSTSMMLNSLWTLKIWFNHAVIMIWVLNIPVSWTYNYLTTTWPFWENLHSETCTQFSISRTDRSASLPPKMSIMKICSTLWRKKSRKLARRWSLTLNSSSDSHLSSSCWDLLFSHLDI